MTRGPLPSGKALVRSVAGQDVSERVLMLPRHGRAEPHEDQTAIWPTACGGLLSIWNDNGLHFCGGPE